MNKTPIIPSQYQSELPMEQIILRENPNSEAVPLDVLFVGAGPSGLAGAIELAGLVKKNPKLGPIEIGVLEKARALGEHCLSGAVINPQPFLELFPEKSINDLPFRQEVKGEKVYFLTESKHILIPTPPTMHNKGFRVASICEVVRWMGAEAEKLGINILTGFPAQSLLVNGDQVVGVRTVATGLDREGRPGNRYVPPTDLSARVTVLSEGTRGLLTQGYIQWKKISSDSPQIYALGVKEVWRVKKSPSEIVHTMGWPLPRDAFGGSFMYPMGDGLISIGLVVGLDYRQPDLDVHYLLQAMKRHPLFKQYLEGGEIVEWGAKTIPEGGYYALPSQLSGDGLLIVGDAAGFVNVPALKGIHYAVQSGILAARAIYEGLLKKDLSAGMLSSFDKSIRESFICKDLYRVRNMRPAFKSGFWVGGAKAALQTLVPGLFSDANSRSHSDAMVAKDGTSPVPGQVVGGLSKVDAVFRSGNITRDDIPRHLITGKEIPAPVAEFYSHVCPAGVYEKKDDRLVVNAPNCVDCKATDILGPRWTPREGGSGPRYQKM